MTGRTGKHVMRYMPRLLRDAGLRAVDVDAHFYADVGASTFFLFWHRGREPSRLSEPATVSSV